MFFAECPSVPDNVLRHFDNLDTATRRRRNQYPFQIKSMDQGLPAAIDFPQHVVARDGDIVEEHFIQ